MGGEKAVVEWSGGGGGRKKKRIRFQGTTARARAVDVDVVHKVKGQEGYLDPDAQVEESREEGWFRAPGSAGWGGESGEEDGRQQQERRRRQQHSISTQGCFLKDELERSRLDGDAGMRGLYHGLYPLCRTLPELLHHSKKICSLLVAKLREPPSCGPRYALQLLSVFARDMQSTIHVYIKDVMNALVSLLKDDVEPELAGLVFTAMGYVFKFDSAKLRADLDCLRPSYGLMLGHVRYFVRRYAAEALAPLLRGAKVKVLKSHLRALIHASAGACEEESHRRDAILDGVSMLLYSISKGVKGRLHSLGPAILRVALGAVGGPQVEEEEEEKVEKKKKKKNSDDITGSGEPHLIRSSSNRDWCAQIVNLMMKQLVHHMRSIHSDSFWMELHYSVGGALENLSRRNGSGSQSASNVEVACLLIKNMYIAVRHERGILLREDAIAEKHLPLLLKSASLGFNVLHPLLASGHLLRSASELWIELQKLFVASWAASPERASVRAVEKLLFASLGLSVPTSDSSILTELHLPSPLATEAPWRFCELLFSSSAPPTAVVSRASIPALVNFCLASNSDDVLCFGILFRIIAACSSSDDLTLAQADPALRGHFARLAAKGIKAVERAKRSHKPDSWSVAMLALRCLPQVVSLCDAESAKKIIKESCVPSLLKTCSAWYDKVTDHSVVGDESFLLNAMIGMTLEVVAALVGVFRNDLPGEFVQSTADDIKSRAISCLLLEPKSLSFLRGAYWVHDTFRDEVNLGDSKRHSDVIAALSRNAQSRMRLVRLFSARLALLLGPESSQAALSLCVQVEETAISVATERDIQSKVSSLEVMARCGQLGPEAAPFIANHCLGLLSLKFASAWPQAQSAFASLASSPTTEALAWRAMEQKLHEVETGTPPLQKSIAADGNSRSLASAFLYSVRKLEEVCCSTGGFFFSDEILLDGECDSAGLDLTLLSCQGLNHDTAVVSSLSHEHGIVSMLASTDAEQLHKLVWGTFKATPELFRRHGKAIVPIILAFVMTTLAPELPDDPLPFIVHNQLEREENNALSARIEEYLAAKEGKPQIQVTSKSALRNRLTNMITSVIDCGPRGLTGSKVIHSILLELLARPDGVQATLGIRGLCEYKTPALVAYKDNLTALSDENLLRGELTKFRETFDTSSSGEDSITPEHRGELVPIVIRLLFGRLLSRGIRGRIASRWPPKARRAAILSFLAGLHTKDELGYLVALMLRSFQPSVIVLGLPLDRSIFQQFDGLSLSEIQAVNLSRRTGFLKLLHDAIRQLGLRLLSYAPTLCHLLLLLLEGTFATSEGNHEVEGETNDLRETESDDEEEESESWASLRSLCLNVWADFFATFASRYDFSSLEGRFWPALSTALGRLPGSCIGSSKPPALLSLIQRIAEVPHDLSTVISPRKGEISPIHAALQCLDSGGGCTSIVNSCLAIIESLGVHMDGKYIKPHLGLLIEIFSKRLGVGSPDHDLQDADKLTKATITRELAVLQMIAGLVPPPQSEPKRAEKLALPPTAAEDLGGALLKCWARVIRQLRKSSAAAVDREGPLMGVMCTYSSLLPLMSDGRRAWGQLSRLLGPYGTKLGFDAAGPRDALVDTLRVASERRDLVEAGAGPCINTLLDLNARDSTSLEELDFGRAVPAYNRLIEGSGWSDLISITESAGGRRCSAESFGGLALGAIAQHCVHSLHAGEVSVKGAASSSLIRLAREIGSEMGCDGDPWHNVLQATLLPALRAGVSSQDQGVRKYYLAILGAVVKSISQGYGAPIPSDLVALSRPDDPEGDFFSNVTHLQLHRRARAMLLVRRNALAFSPATITHYLIPLALHPLHESVLTKAKPGEHMLVKESTDALAGLCAVLPWSHYSRCTRDLMMQVKHASSDHDKHIVHALCKVLDHWHFPVVKVSEGAAPAASFGAEGVGEGALEPAAANGHANHAAIWRGLMGRLLPGLKGLMTVEKSSAEAGRKESSVRANVAVAVVKLIRLLPEEELDAQLGPVMLSVCQTLRSRDSGTRDAARVALAQMVSSLGPKHIGVVYDALSTSLRGDGYQLHVRTFTLATIVRSMEEVGYTPPSESVTVDAFNEEMTDEKRSAILAGRPPFDAALTKAVDMLFDDLFGAGTEARKAAQGGHEVSHVSKTKEAKGAKALDCLETMARLALFRPTHSLAYPSDPASVSSPHALTTPFLLNLVGCESSSVTSKAHECLRRLAVGFSANRSILSSEVFPYIHATCAPFLLAPVDDGEIMDDSSDDSESSVSDDSDENEAIVKNTGWNRGESSHSTGTGGTLADRKLAKVTVAVGANAPRLTGADKYGKKKRQLGDNASSSPSRDLLADPASVGTVVYGLTLFTTYLRRRGKRCREDGPLVDPFVSLLSACIGRHSNDTIVILALSALRMISDMEWPRDRILPELKYQAPTISKKITKLLLRSGVGTDISLACIKTLNSLLQMQVEHGELLNPHKPLGLPRKYFRAILVRLRESGLDTDRGASWLSLAKTIVTARILLPEVYDLMFNFVELAVTCNRAATRSVCSTTLISFIETYPLGQKRQVRHIKAVLEGLSYQHEEGRLAAISMTERLAKHLPVPVLDEHAPLMFITLSQRLGSDPSSVARAGVAEAIRSLLSRVSGDQLHLLLDYALKWASSRGQGNEGEGLYSIGMQAVGIAASARPDLMKRQGRVESALREISQAIVLDTSGSGDEWEPAYFALLCLEKLMKHLPRACEKCMMSHSHTISDEEEEEQGGLLHALSACLLYPHAWVRLVCSRIWGIFLDRRDPKTLAPIKSLQETVNSKSEFLMTPNALFSLAKNQAGQLDRTGIEDKLSRQAVHNLEWIGRALFANRDGERASSAPRDAEMSSEAENDEDEGDGNETDPLAWLIRRMSFMSRAKGEARRTAVFTFFAFMIEKVLDADTTRTFLPHFLTPLRRCVMDAEARDMGTDAQRDGTEGGLPASELAQSTLEILERAAGPGAYLEALTTVNKALESRKERRKSASKILAITDPIAAAQEKAVRAKQKKAQRKRKLERVKSQTEAFKRKRRHT